MPAPDAARPPFLRRLGRLLRGRERRLQLGLAAAALIFFVSLGYSMLQARGQYRLEARMQRSGLWMASHAAIEAARFEAALHRRQAGGLDDAGLREQFEVLYSRILLLRGTDRPEEYAQIERLRAATPELLRTMTVMEEGVARLLAGQAEALPPLLARLGALQDQLREANRQLHLERNHAASEAVSGMRSLTWSFIASGIGLVLSAGLLMGLLVLESRRARAAKRHAEAAAERQAETERTLRALIDSLPAMISAFDREGRFLFMNEAHARFHGPAAQAVPAGEQARLAQALASAGPLPFQERTLRDAEGRERTLLSTAVAVPGFSAADAVSALPAAGAAPGLSAAGAARGLSATGAARGGRGAGRVVFIGLDISDRKAAEERMRHLAEHDPLTDLPNRLLFGLRLNAALAKARAGHSAGFALHCLDIDRFKSVNDRLGHPVGDRLLVAAVERIRSCLRRADTLARIGGDEFAVIQADVSGPQDVTTLAARLVKVMQAPFRIDGSLIESGLSIGSAIGIVHGGHAELLQQRADVALYRAKAEGRSGAVLFDPSMETALQQRREMEGELRRGLEAGELHLLYQPKFCIASGRPIGCEALLRWDHAGRGAIPPALFVPVAEEAGMAATLGRYVLRAACTQALRWREAGLAMPVAVNLSAMLFASDQAVALVREALAESGLPPDLLEIELTEGVFIRNAEAARAALQALHQLGVRVALDDFGTGYSSLAYLQRLPFDVLKIDRAFVRDLTAPEHNSIRIVETILRLAHGLGATVVAEGVETPEQLSALRRLGCDAVQGFLLGRPMPPEAMAALARGAGVEPLRGAGVEPLRGAGAEPLRHAGGEAAAAPGAKAGAEAGAEVGAESAAGTGGAAPEAGARACCDAPRT
ncbi:bifunctional diguanylate cyclase/phosphodiesterase [Pseudoroseomonas cervicalis]|uniref:putative bifunctional diguanylate cyclase/phosphodiesterase n=1 Tax=Teichococcus cervicalis TaxID=204525 RepID=UPI002782649A|nr:EAL domain-containing protein [Pseudoroseomonas cervicalis]MDQ1078251.1 diguanylate cyclase (GGDEF)-like protein [Pseudoroseomonas cervicalis]